MTPEEIIIVNDGTPLLKTVGGLLGNKGYHLKLTDSPEEALLWLGTSNISLVVMKMNGRQDHRLAVLYMVKELNPETRLIILGNHSQFPAEIFEIEADDYVILPCRIAEIWRRLCLCLESKTTTGEAHRRKNLLHPVNQRVFLNLGLMFHDMRGLLTSVSEGMKLLERRFKGKVGQEAEVIFQKTFQKALALNSLTEEFLQKFQNYNDSMSPQELLDLRKDIIDPVVQEFEEEIQNRRITLVNCLSSAVASQQRIQGDRVALKSVFRNLLQNAITHGGVGCSIYLNIDESPGHFRLHVKNSGAPIPPGRQAEMFSAGRRKRDRSQGVGLALQLGRALMRSQGGDISYEPWPKGANFIMSLPRG